MVNRYEIHVGNPDGSDGPMLAFAEQKRMKLKEEIQFYTDSSKTRKVFSFKARQVMDIRAEHDVFDEAGQPLGWFKKDFGASLLNSTWHLAGPNLQATGRERSRLIAVLRRVWKYLPYLGDIWVPFVFHFDFTDQATNTPVLHSEKVWAFRDRYIITVPDQRLDFRVAAAMAVALDALQSR